MQKSISYLQWFFFLPKKRTRRSAMEIHETIFAKAFPIARILGSTAIRVEGKTGKLLVDRSLCMVSLKLRYHLISLLVFSLQFLYNFYVQSSIAFSVADTIITVIGLILLWGSHSFVVSVRNNCDCICSYINGLMQVKLITRKLVGKAQHSI